LYLVSACLVGYPCRWDGASVPDERIINLVKQGKAILVCLSQLGGLTTPRLPAEKQTGPDGELQVVNCEGEDVTRQFSRGAEAE
jgi:uncharacterized protein YbbK (DUF523 family)